jgi:hypothetical protein
MIPLIHPAVNHISLSRRTTRKAVGRLAGNQARGRGVEDVHMLSVTATILSFGTDRGPKPEAALEAS